MSSAATAYGGYAGLSQRQGQRTTEVSRFLSGRGPRRDGVLRMDVYVPKTGDQKPATEVDCLRVASRDNTAEPGIHDASVLDDDGGIRRDLRIDGIDQVGVGKDQGHTVKPRANGGCGFTSSLRTRIILM